MADSSNPSEKFFADRAEEGGVYDSATTQMRTMENALANLEYIGTKKKSPNIFRSTDWAKNIVFRESALKDSPEFKVAIIGEICDSAHGTAIRASGNHYDGRDGEPFKPVDDKSKVKDVIVLRAPTLCDQDLLHFYDNQTAVIQDIENTEEALDEAAGMSPDFRSCLRSERADTDSKNLITIMTQKKYSLPASAGGPKLAVAASPTKVKRVKRKFGDEDDEDSDTAAPAERPAASDTVQYLSDSDVKLGAFYDPRVLEDYGGPYFQHINAKLVQLDIRDADNKLIPPWKQYSALRPGSFVLVLATIHIFIFKDASNDRSRDRKFMQLSAHTIRVLDESEFPVHKRTRPIPRTMTDEQAPTTGPSTPGRSSATSAFNSFVVTPRSSPSKNAGSGDVDMEEEKSKRRKRK
ncbi:hypothetical protein B0H13DRAFT_2484977 [Mycena leptocephala]|nr:hypothetical protein B0H13DRAFT_2484977 [Mycena leptocephala]